MKNNKFIILFFLIYPLKLFSYEKTVCIKCHLESGDEYLMKPVHEWEKSIHAENAISCHNCHGGNPKDEETAMSEEFGFIGKPKYEEIPEFCGKCHAGVKENYLKSAHGQTLPDGPNCVTCHTAHSQQKAGLFLINRELCSTCHDYERAEKIKFALMNTENTILKLSKKIEELWINGFNVDELNKNLFATRNSFRRLTHIVEVDYILEQTGGIYSDLGKIEEEIKKKEDILNRRKLLGAIVIIFFLISAYVFGKIYEELKREIKS
ncbi:MAG: cytochrome c3 family protein [candidate division WOR-3 bacterium]